MLDNFCYVALEVVMKTEPVGVTSTYRKFRTVAEIDTAKISAIFDVAHLFYAIDIYTLFPTAIKHASNGMPQTIIHYVAIFSSTLGDKS